MDALELPVDVEFQIHAASIAIQGMDRDELEEAFIEMLHQKAVDKQMFLKRSQGPTALMPISNSTSPLLDKSPKYHG